MSIAYTEYAHMTNDEKILAILEKHGKALDNLQAGQERVEKTQHEQGAAITELQQGQERIEKTQQQQSLVLGRITTVLKVMEAGQNDIRENMATKADVQDIKSDQAKQKRRIENLEETTKTPNPHKN